MNKTRPVVILLGVLLSGCVSTSVQHLQHIETERGDRQNRTLPVLGKESTLKDYLQYAALNNPGLEAAFNQWKAAVERIPQSRSLNDPQFTYSYFIEKVETRVGAQRQKIELSQMFPWFGTLGLKGDMAAEAAEAVYQRYETAKLKLFYTVKKNYYEYYYLAKAIAITEHNMKLLSELETVARTKFKTGSAKHSSVIKAQVELGRLEDKLQTFQDFRGPLTAKLNAALNRPLGSDLPCPAAIEDINASLSENELFALLRSSSPELKALEHTADKESAGVKLARKSYYPNIMIGAGLIQTGDAAMPDVNGSGKDPIIAMVGISLPIWQGKYRAEVREAKAKEKAALEHLKDSENNLMVDVQLAFYHFRDAERKINLYKKGLIPKARESMEVNKQAFESGNTDFLDVIDSERVLLEFELSHERALTDRAQLLAELEMLVGKELLKGTQ